MNPQNTPAPTQRKRVYVLAAEVAQACGLSLVELETRYRPDSWGAPRDFTFCRQAVLYNEASLPQLADALIAAGQTDAALCLREYIKKVATAGAWFVPTPESQPAKVDRAVLPSDERSLEEINQSLVPAAAHGREQRRYYWEDL